MQYIQSAEQKHILDTLESNNQGLKVKYLDKTVAIQTLLFDALEQLKAGKSIKIVCPNSDMLSKVEEMLSIIGLSDYSIRLDTSDSIPIKTVSQLRANFKQKSVNNSKEVSRHEFSFVNADILTQYQNLHTSVLDKYKVRDIPQILSAYQFDNTQESTISIDNIWANHEGQDYTSILDAVYDIANLYNPIYRELDASEVLSKSAISKLGDSKSINQTIEKLERIQVTLELFNDGLQNIAKEYAESFFNQKEDDRNELKLKLKKTILGIAKGEYDTNSQKGGFSLLRKQKTQDSLSEVIATITAELTAYDSDIQAVNEELNLSNDLAISHLQAAYNKLSTAKNTDASEYIRIEKHLSLLNQENEEWINLSQSLSEYLDYLQQEDLLTPSFENNSKSLLKQKLLVSTILNSTNRAISRLEQHDDYYNFQAKYGSDASVQAILSELVFHPRSTWVSKVEKAYFRQKKSDLSILPLPSNSTYIETAINLPTQIYQDTINVIIDSITKGQVEALPRIKSSDKLLFQSLIKKTLPMQSTAFDFANNFPEHCRSLFPIVISKEHTAITCDVVYALDGTTNDNDIRLSFSEFTKEDFNNLTEEKEYFPLYLNYYGYTQSLAQMASSEKIKAAKKLAKLLLANNQNIKIYQLKEASIVSLLPTFQDQRLESILMENGGKVMHMDDIYHSLVECILVSERENYLLIKDGLLQSEQVDSYLWQSDILNKYRSAGIKVRSVYTKDLLADLDLVMAITSEILASRNDNATAEVTDIIENKEVVNEAEAIPSQV